MTTFPKLARHDWVAAQLDANASDMTAALAEKVSVPSGVATPGYVLAVKQEGGYEHIPAPSGGSGGSGGSSAVYYSASTGWPSRPAGSVPVTWVDPTGTAPAPPALDGDLVYVAGSSAPSTGIVQILPDAVRNLDSGWWQQTSGAEATPGPITLSGATVVKYATVDYPVKPNTVYKVHAYPSSGSGTYGLEAMVTVPGGSNQFPWAAGLVGTTGYLTFTTGPTATMARFYLAGEANQTVTIGEVRVFEG